MAPPFQRSQRSEQDDADDIAILSGSRKLRKNVDYLIIRIGQYMNWAKKWTSKLNIYISQLINFFRKPRQAIDNFGIVNWLTTCKPNIKYLTWGAHIKHFQEKIQTHRKSLWPFIKTDSKLRLYKTWNLPTIMYTSTIWGQTSNTDILKREWQQNWLLRPITGAPWFIRNGWKHRDLEIDGISRQSDSATRPGEFPDTSTIVLGNDSKLKLNHVS